MMLAAGLGSRRNWGRRTPASMPPTRARRGRCGRSMTSRSSAGRWPGCLRGSVPCWCCATGRICPSPRSRTSSAARPGRSPAPHPAQQPGWPRRLPATGCLPPNPPAGHHERNHLMPTEELENQLRSTLARAAADFENPGQARQRLLQRDYHPRRRDRRLAAGITTGAALIVGLVAVIAAVGHGPATKATPLAAPALRTRLLAAIDTASGDILYARGGPAPGGGTWQSPAYPRPGQKVHIRILRSEEHTS